MSLPDLPADATLSMVGWRYHLVSPCPAVSVPAKLGANELQVVNIPKDQLITVTNGPFNGARGWTMGQSRSRLEELRQ